MQPLVGGQATTNGVDLEVGVVITLPSSSTSLAQGWYSVVVVFKNDLTDIYYYVNGQVCSTTPTTLSETLPFLFPYFDPAKGNNKEAAPAGELSVAQMLVLSKEPGDAEVAEMDRYFEEVKRFYGV